MKRFLSISLTVILISTFWVSDAQTNAQTPVATPDPFALPVNLLLLRIREGNGYEFMTNEAGQLDYDNTYLIRDGVMPRDIPPDLGDVYTELGLQDMYYMQVALSQEDAASSLDGQTSISVETRLTTLQDGESAARLVGIYPDLLADQAQDDDSGSISVMKDPPVHDQAIIGVTGIDRPSSLTTGEPTGVAMPYARFIAQHGATVASVKVSSLDVGFNDSVARELLTAQLGCIEADEFCVPVALPALADNPATASPVAVHAHLGPTTTGRFNARCRV